MSYVFRAEGIAKAFGDRQVLKNASVWGEGGKITTLMGRNGVGKSTLLRIAVGDLRADQGVVFFEAYVGERPSLARLASKGLFWVPQEQLLSRHYSVRDHLRAVEARFKTGRSQEAVEALGIVGTLDQRVSELSGGERMRVSLALAVARRPTCLVIDEPFARVAPKDQEVLGTALRSLTNEGTAVITSGHDASVLLSVSDSIIWCVAGTTHHLGTPQQALQHDQFVREYLGPGYASSGPRIQA